MTIGDVAAATGVTVRTLRHYDELGLLVPSERTAAGYRLYAEAELDRLYRILALRRMGFALEAIGAVLDGDGEDPRPAVRRHLPRWRSSCASRWRSGTGSRASSTCSTARTSRREPCSSTRSR